FGSERVLERVLAAIEPALPQCALISFSLEFLRIARARHPVRLGAVFDRWSERAELEEIELDPEYVFCDVDGLPRSGRLEHPGAKIAVYEIDDPALARALAARGVHLVESFAIGEMIAAFRALGTEAE